MPHLPLVLVKAGNIVIALVAPGALVRGSIVEDLTVCVQVVVVAERVAADSTRVTLQSLVNHHVPAEVAFQGELFATNATLGRALVGHGRWLRLMVILLIVGVMAHLE